VAADVAVVVSVDVDAVVDAVEAVNMIAIAALSRMFIYHLFSSFDSNSDNF
jgi:hypothetical protein